MKAFPSGVFTDDKGRVIGGHMGMELRDYFAAKAMQGMCANTNDDHDAQIETYEEYVDHVAECAYKIADAMIRRKEKPSE